MFVRYRERGQRLAVSLIGRQGHRPDAVLSGLGSLPREMPAAASRQDLVRFWTGALARLDHLRETGEVSAAERARVVVMLAERVPVPERGAAIARPEASPEASLAA
jgi:hypothetical protein